jgi:hypothetical protein
MVEINNDTLVDLFNSRIIEINKSRLGFEKRQNVKLVFPFLLISLGFMVCGLLVSLGVL